MLWVEIYKNIDEFQCVNSGGYLGKQFSINKEILWVLIRLNFEWIHTDISLDDDENACNKYKTDFRLLTKASRPVCFGSLLDWIFTCTAFVSDKTRCTFILRCAAKTNACECMYCYCTTTKVLSSLLAIYLKQFLWIWPKYLNGTYWRIHKVLTWNPLFWIL